MLYLYNVSFLGDSSLISGTSILKDKLNEKIASDILTVKCMPLCDEIANFCIGNNKKLQEVLIEG